MNHQGLARQHGLIPLVGSLAGYGAGGSSRQAEYDGLGKNPAGRHPDVVLKSRIGARSEVAGSVSGSRHLVLKNAERAGFGPTPGPGLSGF